MNKVWFSLSVRFYSPVQLNFYVVQRKCLGGLRRPGDEITGKFHTFLITAFFHNNLFQ